jgi:hypothetical protein
MRTIIFLLLTSTTFYSTKAQTDREQEKTTADSIYIVEVENKKGPHKVLHAEPLYIDLIRDLGARKGEKEWNLGVGLMDNNTYDQYTSLVEYEWAPINRLGLEVELPFSFYYPTSENGKAPNSKLNSLKLAGQYTFLVSERTNTSMALGYIHEFEMVEFNRYRTDNVFNGNIYNPFYVAAKRWGQNFHSLLYTGPQFLQHFSDKSLSTLWQINSNLHYMIPGSRNFVGIEFNKEVTKRDFDMTIRPQMRVGIKENLLIGIVTGIPISRENERFSTFLRIIYEPGHKTAPVLQ